MPDWMEPEARIALLQGYMEAVIFLRGRRGSRAAEAVFTEIFCQRHHVRARLELDRAALSEIAGVSERQITTVLRWLHANGFIFQGRDASGRKLGTPMLVSTWLVHRVFHRLSTNDATGKSSSPSHYKDLPRRTPYGSEEPLYSDAAALDRARRDDNRNDLTRSHAPWTKAKLAWHVLGALGATSPPRKRAPPGSFG